jgi:type I restriction enzyme M protein
LNNFNDKVNFIWSIADLIRDEFRRSDYQDVILPFTVLRRIDCVLTPTRERVRQVYADTQSRGLGNPDALLRSASGFSFYNTSRYDFDALVGDSRDLARNLKAYIQGFSPNMRQVLEKFAFNATIDKLAEKNLLFLVLEKFNTIDLHPDVVGNHEMGYIFEELIRRFNEALNENPGEHFTPREVIQLMVDAIILPDRERLQPSGYVVLLYDPCCGSGGMLTTGKERILEINPQAQVELYGQEVNDETYAICKSDLYMKSADGRDAEHIALGNTLKEDAHPHGRFDYMLANPPYGKEWKGEQAAVEEEAKRGYHGRFGAGTPRISDGQLLFLQHMIARMRPLEDGGSRIGIVMNGSPLFTGDAGSGESEIRRWILENDWLDAIIALPGQLFYNTGIGTYIWVLTNRKDPARRHKVQLIDATGERFWSSMRKSLGQKRREITATQIAEIIALYQAFDAADPDVSKVFDTIEFGYRKVTIERPLRLNFTASAERLERLGEQSAFKNLAVSKKRDSAERAKEEAAGQAEQAAILAMLATLPPTLYTNRDAFLGDLNAAAKAHRIKLAAPLIKAIVSALGERDETADICTDSDGQPEPDSELRDYEYVRLEAAGEYAEDPLRYERVPLKQNVDDYFRREVQPYLADAWVNEKVTDPKDGNVGVIGYEINFNRYFYKYQPPRPLHEIETDIRKLEAEILDMLRGITH